MVVLSVSLSLAGCGFNKTEESPKPVYGVVDLETVVKAHPKYSEYFRLETEYNHMLATYQSEQHHLISIASTQEKMNLALKEQTISQAEKNEYTSRVKAKEDELNEGLRALYDKINAAHQKTSSGSSLNISSENGYEIANLQLQLSVMDLSASERAADEARLNELLNGRLGDSNTQDMSGWTEEEKQQMEAAKTEAASSLDAYAKSVAEEIKARQAQRKAQLADSTSAGLPDADVWNNQWSASLKAKQNEMAKVKEEIMKDIRKDAARIAEKDHLTMIFSKYSANVTGVDVTSELVSAVVSDTK